MWVICVGDGLAISNSTSDHITSARLAGFVMHEHGLGKQKPSFLSNNGFACMVRTAREPHCTQMKKIEFQEFNELGAAVPVVQLGPLWFVALAELVRQHRLLSD